jgi:hypothetical protein
MNEYPERRGQGRIATRAFAASRYFSITLERTVVAGGDCGEQSLRCAARVPIFAADRPKLEAGNAHDAPVISAPANAAARA